MKVIQRQQQQQQQRQRRSRILPSIFRFGFAVALGMTLQTLFLSSSSFDSVQQQEMAAATTAVVSNDFFTTTTTTRPSADASTRTINPTTREEDSTTTFNCQSYLLEILQRQDCFRQRMSQEGVLRNNGNNNNTDCCQSGRGTKTTKSTNMFILPFHNYAGYHGQGFGRIVEHTVLSCLFATMILQRPCTLDFDSCRDVYWTWRSFINVNTFNWDWNILSTTQRHDIIHTLQTNLPLPLEKSDEWPNNNNFNNSQVLPLKWNNNNNNNKTLEDHLNEWKAGGGSGTSNHNNKILVSPNWGNDWYRHVPLSNLINEATHGQCKFNKFRTVLQNSMYAPTSLSKTLHQERIHRLLLPLLLSPEKNKQEQQPRDQQPQQQQQDGYKYGAIHLRSILSDASIRMDYSISHPEIVNALSQCLLKATKTKSSNGISVWWIIGDNRTIAEHMKQSLQERHHSSSSSSAFNNNNSWQFVLEDDEEFWNALMHSGHAMKQRYHQEQMASSMMDFMVLHESTVAIVSHGAFGSTGARGNGKVKVQSCAPHQMFSIYN
eukprot:scaffold8541_cov70-Cylindrotheca_fusiformis.AAC.2